MHLSCLLFTVLIVYQITLDCKTALQLTRIRNGSTKAMMRGTWKEQNRVRAWIKVGVGVRVRPIELPPLYLDLISSDWVTTESLKAKINLKIKRSSHSGMTVDINGDVVEKLLDC